MKLHEDNLRTLATFLEQLNDLSETTGVWFASGIKLKVYNDVVDDGENRLVTLLYDEESSTYELDI